MQVNNTICCWIRLRHKFYSSTTKKINIKLISIFQSNVIIKGSLYHWSTLRRSPAFVASANQVWTLDNFISSNRSLLLSKLSNYELKSLDCIIHWGYTSTTIYCPNFLNYELKSLDWSLSKVWKICVTTFQFINMFLFYII